MKLHKTLALATTLMGVMGAAQAAIITYDFASVAGDTGSFSYDDTATPTGATVGAYGPGYTTFNAVSFIVNGAPAQTPTFVIYFLPGYLNQGTPSVFLTDAAAPTTASTLELDPVDPNFFHGTNNLAPLDGTSLSAFTVVNIGTTAYLQVGGDLNPFSTLSSLVEVVPIPGALWLFGSALGLLGIRRRMQATV